MYLKIVLMLSCAAVISASAQDNPTGPAYKNDISILYGAESNHIRNKIPSLEYRRNLNDAWKMKVTLMGDRSRSDRKTLRTTSFDLSDTAIMRRTEFLTYGLNKTFHLGVDYTKLEHFSIGAQFIIGTADGYSNLSDRAYIQFEDGEEPITGWTGYSDELTMAYHPYELSPIEISRLGSWTESTGRIRYIGFGLGLSLEAKWPITKHMEAALQYRPEMIYYSLRDYSVRYDTDTYITTDYPNFFDFYHFAHLLFRYKF